MINTHPTVTVTLSGSTVDFDPPSTNIPAKGKVNFACHTACLLCFSDHDFFTAGASYRASEGTHTLTTHDKPDGNRCIVTGTLGSVCVQKDTESGSDSCTVVIGSGVIDHHHHGHEEKK